MFVLVGDVVASRRVTDESRLLDGLAEILEDVNARITLPTPLRLVVRDEFHGVADSLGAACEAALRLRLAARGLVLPTVGGEEEPVDLRIGIGQGTSTTAPGQGPTGTAWWHAHDARRAAQELPDRAKWPPSLRTVLRSDDRMLAAAASAHLLLQDQLLARMDASDGRALLGLLDGERQVDIAEALGVTQPAVARRVKDRGALAITRALAELRAVTPADEADPSPVYSPPEPRRNA